MTLAILVGLLILPVTVQAQGGFGGQGGMGIGGGGFGGGGFGGGGFGGNSFGGGLSGGFGQLGSSFGQSGGFGQLGSAFNQSGGSGGFLGSRQGFRPNGGTGLNGRLPTGSSSSDPFGSFRADPRSSGAASANTTGMGMGNNRMGTMTGMGMNGMNMNRFGSMSGFNQFGMNRGNMMGMGMNGMGMGMNGMNQANTPRPGYVLQHHIPQPPAPPPSQTVARLENSLRASPSIRSLQNLSIRMDGDAVILSGTVGSESEKSLSEAILRLEPGVYRVRNDLQVRPNGTGSGP
jgi:hypothetical protein